MAVRLEWPGRKTAEKAAFEADDTSDRMTATERFSVFSSTERVSAEQGRAGADRASFPAGDNSLYHCDNLAAMRHMLSDRSMAGRVDLIYVDPPFATGREFHVMHERTRSGGNASRISEAYSDTWDGGAEGYLDMFLPRILLARELLAESGSVMVHVDHRLASHIKLLLDEIFGAGRFRNSIVWHYRSGGTARGFYPRKHDTILWYSRGRKPYFDPDAVSMARNVCPACGAGVEGRNNMKRNVDPDGRVYRTIRSAGKVYRYYDDEGAPLPDVWIDINHLQQKDPERTGYATQKPLRLLERIVAAHSPEGGLVADLFAGSGTTAAASAALRRRFVACDSSAAAAHVIKKRMLRLETAGFTVFSAAGKRAFGPGENCPRKEAVPERSGTTMTRGRQAVRRACGDAAGKETDGGHRSGSVDLSLFGVLEGDTLAVRQAAVRSNGTPDGLSAASVSASRKRSGDKGVARVYDSTGSVVSEGPCASGARAAKAAFGESVEYRTYLFG